MTNINYYDICDDCGSEDLIIEDSQHDNSMVTIYCRDCGAEWDDYIEDIQSDYS